MIRTLPFVLLLLSIAPALAQTGQNINHALLGTATQSADHPTYPTAVASRCIDGNRNGHFFNDNSCNTTAVMAQPWWQVALAGPRLVHEVVLYCRADAELTFVTDLFVELKSGSTVLWSQRACTGNGYPIRGGRVRLLMPPGGITCDAVRISRPNATASTVTLAEVEVLEIAPITPVNWAIYGTAASAGGATSYPAARAIDGNTDSFLTNGSCAMTSVNGSGGGDWWEVALPRQRYDEVKVWFSTHASPIGPFYVRTFDGTSTVATQLVSSATPNAPTVVSLTANAYVDRVRVLRNSFSSPLIIAEVEVFNHSALDAEAKDFGTGCRGSAGVPALRQVTAPIHDSNFDVRLTNVPSNPGVAFVVTGLSRTANGALPLPIDLVALGAAGCQGYLSLELTQLVIAASGTANSTLTIPNLGWIIGLELQQQAFVIDPGVNALGATVSNALRLRIGL
ncbi:MAG: hypothetical protein IPK26_19935 [Planctomycetes bacterium]|nr:hypothetical protein [Planctomycetota bacterium]